MPASQPAEDLEDEPLAEHDRRVALLGHARPSAARSAVARPAQRRERLASWSRRASPAPPRTAPPPGDARRSSASAERAGRPARRTARPRSRPVAAWTRSRATTACGPARWSGCGRRAGGERERQHVGLRARPRRSRPGRTSSAGCGSPASPNGIDVDDARRLDAPRLAAEPAARAAGTAAGAAPARSAASPRKHRLPGRRAPSQAAAPSASAAVAPRSRRVRWRSSSANQ